MSRQLARAPFHYFFFISWFRIRWKTLHGAIHFVAIISWQVFALVTAAQMLCYLKNTVVITLLEFKSRNVNSGFSQTDCEEFRRKHYWNLLAQLSFLLAPGCQAVGSRVNASVCFNFHDLAWIMKLTSASSTMYVVYSIINVTISVMDAPAIIPL